MKPGKLRLEAQRWTPFVCRILFPNMDLGGAGLSAQIRLYADAPGAPLIDLAKASTNAEGLSLSVESTDGAPTSVITMRVNETTLEGILPFPSNREPDEVVELAWAMHITLSPIGKRRWLEGPFLITPGANH